MKYTKGFNLIEVLVTTVVLSMGLLGLAALQTAAIKEGSDSSQHSQATWLSQELLERMRANPDGLAAGYTTAAGQDLCEAGPTKYCADYFDGTDKVDAATDCTADEAAEFDVWELTCGYARDGIVSGPLDHMKIPDGGFDLTCVDSDPADADPCTDGSDFTATMTFTSAAASSASTHGYQSHHKENVIVIRPTP